MKCIAEFMFELNYSKMEAVQSHQAIFKMNQRNTTISLYGRYSFPQNFLVRKDYSWKSKKGETQINGFNIIRMCEKEDSHVIPSTEICMHTRLIQPPLPRKILILASLATLSLICQYTLRWTSYTWMISKNHSVQIEEIIEIFSFRSKTPLLNCKLNTGIG